MKIRAAREDDLPFVVDTWRRSFADSDYASHVTPHDAAHMGQCGACGAWAIRTQAGKTLSSREYWTGQLSLIQRLVSGCTTMVCDSDDGILDGFSCYALSPPTIHYVYVRRSARGKGVARALLSELSRETSIVYTHRTRQLRGARLPRGLSYDPYALYSFPARGAA